MRAIRKYAAVAAFIAMPVSALAAPFTVELKSSGSLATFFGDRGTEWTLPGGFMTIQSTGGSIWLGSDRLGVAGTSTNPAHRQQLNINESLRFTFAAPVTDVTFTRNGGPFPVNLSSYDAEGDLVFSASRAYPSSLPSDTVVNGPNNTPILSFLLQGVFGSSAGITSITYTIAETATPVSLPGTGLLLLGGLAAMAGIRRKQAANR